MDLSELMHHFLLPHTWVVLIPFQHSVVVNHYLLIQNTMFKLDIFTNFTILHNNTGFNVNSIFTVYSSE